MIINYMIIQCDGETPRHILRAHGGCLAHFLSANTFYTGEICDISCLYLYLKYIDKHMHICINWLDY